MKPRVDIVGMILAGGKSKRMGNNKALLQLDGRPIIGHVAQTLQQAFEHVAVVSDQGASYEFLRLPVYPDVRKDCGPLGGIHAGFLHSGAQNIFVAACDTPYISKDLIEYIIDYPTEAPVKVAWTDDMIHPLCGLYSRTALPAIEQALERKELQVKLLLKRVGAAKVSIATDLPFYHPLLLRNINTPADFEKISPHHPSV